MSDLIDDVPHLKRAVAVPGEFDTVFPSTLDVDLEATLADAFAEVQLFGFLSDYELTFPTTVSPDLSVASRALVVLFAAYRVLSNQVANLKSHVRYEAPGVVFEQDQGPSMLVQRMKQIGDERQYLIDKGEESASYQGGMWMGDQAFVRAVAGYGYGLFGAEWDYHDAFGA